MSGRYSLLFWSDETFEFVEIKSSNKLKLKLDYSNILHQFINCLNFSIELNIDFQDVAIDQFLNQYYLCPYIIEK